MHDVLRQRLIRKIESLPDEQIYQILDYIEFLESKYAVAEAVEASGLQKFAEGLEDRLRKKAVSPSTIREAFQLISAADRVLSGVSSAGRRVVNDLNQALQPDERTEEEIAAADVQSFEADPRKSRTGASGESQSPAGAAGDGDPSGTGRTDGSGTSKGG